MRIKLFILTLLLQGFIILGFIGYNSYLQSNMVEAVLETTPIYVYSENEPIYINYNFNELSLYDIKTDFDYKKYNGKIVYLKINNEAPAKVISVTKGKPEGIFIKAKFSGYSDVENKIFINIKGEKQYNNGRIPITDDSSKYKDGEKYKAKVGIDNSGNIHFKDIYK